MQPAQQPPRHSIIDSRLHLPDPSLTPSPVTSWNLDEAGFVRYLDRCGVERGVVHAVRPPSTGGAGGYAAANRKVLRFVEKHKNRFTAACILDPGSVEESLREMEEWKRRFGMVWVGELRFAPREQGFPRDAFDRLMRHAVSLGMVVTVNTDMDGVNELARTHSQATVVLAQLEAGADRPELLRRIEVAAGGKNFYVEAGPRGYERMGLVEFAVDRVGANRVLYGSNFATTSAAAVIARVDNAFLSPEHKEAILFRNTQTLLEKVGWRFQ